MPKVIDNIPKLTIPQLRTLKALQGGGAFALGEIRKRAGSADGAACAALVAMGLSRRHDLDLDGLKETVWQITPAGEAAVGGFAGRDAYSGWKTKGFQIGALVQIFGGNRMLGPKVAEALAGVKWVGIPFCGGLSELPHIKAVKARTVVCSDTHAHVINLCRAVTCRETLPDVEERLERTLFHQLELSGAQARCNIREAAGEEVPEVPDPDWAADYFACAWMSRAGSAGTKGEFRAPLSIRWEASGGDSVKRFRNAAGGLRHWCELLADCVTFLHVSAFSLLAKVKDTPDTGVYCDPPFLGQGGSYKCSFGPAEHDKLAAVLGGFAAARIVVRAYDDPRVDTLYPVAGGWVKKCFVGKRQTGFDAPEILLIKNGGANAES